MQRNEMKTMRRIMVLFLVLILGISLVACGSRSIVGVWEWNQDIFANDEIIGVIQRVIEFTEDNNFITTENGEIIAEGSFSIDGSSIILFTDDSENGAEYPFRWENGNLILTFFNEEMTFVRR